MIKILMIEDDIELAELLTKYLAKYKISLVNSTTPMRGMAMLEKNKYDLVILDLSLPNMDGLELCKIILEKMDIPIIISSARSETSDKVSALEIGADDYLPKPYDPRELVARIQSLIRRIKKTNSTKETIDNKNFYINTKEMIIYKDKKALKLTRGEYEILKLFIKKNGYVLSREEMADYVSEIGLLGSERSIDVIVSRLRHKLGDNSKQPKHIHSVRGVGYKFLT